MVAKALHDDTCSRREEITLEAVPNDAVAADDVIRCREVEDPCRNVSSRDSDVHVHSDMRIGPFDLCHDTAQFDRVFVVPAAPIPRATAVMAVGRGGRQEREQADCTSEPMKRLIRHAHSLGRSQPAANFSNRG